MRVTLFDTNAEMVQAWAMSFGSTKGVSIYREQLKNIGEHDCLVSPANSFGIMDGGIDAAICEVMPEVQRLVQLDIAKRYYGEQPVGTSMLVKMQHGAQFRYLAHTPTMRSPRFIRPGIVYDSMRAMLLAVDEFNRGWWPKIESIACPGLGTGTGGVTPEDAARMMALAYDSIVMKPSACKDWDEATTRLMRIGA